LSIHPVAVVEKYWAYLAPAYTILSYQEAVTVAELDVPDIAISLLSNLGLAMLSISAMTRDTPAEVKAALLYHLRGRPQVDLGSSLETIQYLLLISTNIEMLSPDSNASSGMSSNLVGLAVKMGHDIGLHRKISQLNVSSQHLNRRARIWAACVIQDAWYAISYGHPCLIHAEDCDAPGPSFYQDDQAVQKSSADTARVRYDVQIEHYKLCEIMARLIRLVFTPTGLQKVTTEELENLKRMLDDWSANLPAPLRWSGPPSKEMEVGAGFLHLMKIHLLSVRLAQHKEHEQGSKDVAAHELEQSGCPVGRRH
jgi:hypothetical protein